MHVLSNTYFAPLLLRNRRHAALAAALGPRPFRSLARYLLRPAAPVAADVDAFLHARRHGTLAPPDALTDAAAPAAAPAAARAAAPPRPLVGMHARTQDWMRVPLESYWGCMPRRTLKRGPDPSHGRPTLRVLCVLGAPSPPWRLERAASKPANPTTAFDHSGCALRRRTTTRG